MKELAKFGMTAWVSCLLVTLPMLPHHIQFYVR